MKCGDMPTQVSALAVSYLFDEDEDETNGDIASSSLSLSPSLSLLSTEGRRYLILLLSRLSSQTVPVLDAET